MLGTRLRRRGSSPWLVEVGVVSVGIAIAAGPATLLIMADATTHVQGLAVVAAVWAASTGCAWAVLRRIEPAAVPAVLAPAWGLVAAGLVVGMLVGDGGPDGLGAAALLVVSVVGVGLGVAAVVRPRRDRTVVAAGGGLVGVGLAHAVYIAELARDGHASFADVFLLAALTVAGAMIGLGGAVVRVWQRSRARAVRSEHELESARSALASVRQAQAELLHETRNVLLVVDGASRALERDASALPDRDRRQLQRAVRVELHLLRHLTDHAQGGTDRPASSTRVGEVVDRQARLAAQRGVDVAAHVEGEPITTMAPDGLEELVLNLLLNAERHGEGEQVELAARPDPESGQVVLTVADRGPGPDRSRAAGHGLGLRICRRLVSVEGGQLTFEARDGGGAVATVRIPGPRSRPGHPATTDHLPSLAR